jgi:hypothetical protein
MNKNFFKKLVKKTGVPNKPQVFSLTREYIDTIKSNAYLGKKGIYNSKICITCRRL